MRYLKAHSRIVASEIMITVNLALTWFFVLRFFIYHLCVRDVQPNLMVCREPYHNFKGEKNKMRSAFEREHISDRIVYVCHLYLCWSLFILLDNGWLHVMMLCLEFPHLLYLFVLNSVLLQMESNWREAYQQWFLFLVVG